MTSTNQRLIANEVEISNLNARILAITPNNLIFAALGAFVKFGCKVTEGSDDTDLILALEGQASGDSANLNPDLSVTPTRQFEFPNIASLKGGDFVSLDTSATVTTAPTTGTSRYDIAYIFAGKEGAGFAIAAGSPSASVLSDFTANGLQTGDFGEESPDFDPSIPVGAVAVARIYVAEDVTAIVDADIADLRSFSSFQSAIVADAFAVPPALGSTTPNVVNATTLNAVDGNFTGDIDISHTASPSLTLTDTTTGGVSAKLQVTDTLATIGTTSADDFLIQRNSVTVITVGASDITLIGDLLLANNKSIQIKDAGGTFRSALTVDAGDDLILGNSNYDNLILRVGALGTALFFADITGNANFTGTVVVGDPSVAADGSLHVHTDTAGVVTAVTGADDFVIENSATGGGSILIPDSATGQWIIGSPSLNKGAIFSWAHDSDEAILASSKVGASLILKADDEVPNLSMAGASGSETAVFAGTVQATDGLGVYGVTPPAQASHIVDPSGGATVDAEARTAINAMLVVMENVGFQAAA